jgi:hypothetical protein
MHCAVSLFFAKYKIIVDLRFTFLLTIICNQAMRKIFAIWLLWGITYSATAQTIVLESPQGSQQLTVSLTAAGELQYALLYSEITQTPKS